MTMRMQHVRAAAVMLAALACIAGCGSKHDPDDRGRGSDAPRLDDMTLTRRREFQESVERRLHEIGATIDDLRIRARDASATERVRLDRLIDDLGLKRDEASAQLRELRAVAAEKWGDLRDRLEVALRSVEERIKESVR